jgi:hypothetical protein
MQRLLTFLLAVCLVLVSPNAIAQSAWPAGKVLFTDADDLQEKFDAGDLGGGGGALDNITTVTCSANQAVIGSTTGVYRITTGCVADDTILIPNLSTFLATTIILQSIINDTRVPPSAFRGPLSP